MKRILATLLLVLASQGVQAGAIKVWPIKVTLSPDKTTESVKLTNETDKLVNLQVSATSWDIDENGEFIESDTGDFVFFPRLITVPPGEDKAVRVGYQGDFPRLEKPYRLIIEELPPVLEPDQQENKKRVGVQYVLRLSLPLFVMPGERPPAPEIGIDGIRVSENGVQVGVKAAGTHHVEVTKVEGTLLGAGDRELASAEQQPRLLRVLPERRVFVDMPLNTTVCGQAQSMLVKVHAKGLEAPYEQKVPLAAGRCREAP